MSDEMRQKQEDEWFRRHERQLLEQARAQRLQRQKEREQQELASERERNKKLHWMKCPKCGHDLLEVEHQGVKVDRCGFCEGVFFDAGELEQLLLNAHARRGLFRKLAGLFG
jgi:hypothetical protein